MLTAGLVAAIIASPAWAQDVTVVDRPPAQGTNDHYISNRAPLAPTPLIQLPIRSIRPGGWLRRQLLLQSDGFHGHLGEISPFLKKQGNAWLDPRGMGDHGWEEAPYWLKGYGAAAYILRDETMLRETRVWIESTLHSQKPDGWFGPDADRAGLATDLKSRDDLWPNMIMLFCLQDYHDDSGDERVIALMTNYFRYLTTVPEERFLIGYWPKMRGGDLLYSVYWLYNRTGEPWLLELAQKVHRRTADWAGDVINWHNVNIAQGFGQPATYFMQSRHAPHLQAAYRNYQKVRDLYGQVPGGMFGSDENCRPGFADPRQAVETCGMVEMMLSLETLVQITGDPLWADRCEDVAFNSLPAALTADLKALRYLTAPNMAISDREPKNPGIQNGGPMFLMDPHDHRCCQHNVGHGWPYFARSLWFATPDNGLAALFYAECELTAKVADGVEVVIRQQTRYPFDSSVRFMVRTPRETIFPLYLRVPGWCETATVKVNDKTVDFRAEPLKYIRLHRVWRDGDVIELTLPMSVRVQRWASNHDSVSVHRGPLTYSLKIGERYVRAGGTDRWPAWEIHPTTPWNYGLTLDADDPAKSFEVLHRPWPADDTPFTPDAAPILLQAKGKRIRQWTLDETGLLNTLQPSPVRSDQPIDSILLIPMGAARLRLSAFPVIGEGPSAHDWIAPPRPLGYKASASHVWQGDTLRALGDGRIPTRSADQTIPRHTWWDHRGTVEWVQYDLDEPTTVTGVEVYWFDDTGIGRCRVPESWKVLIRRGDQWRPVEGVGLYGVKPDQFNQVSFTPVVTDAIRLEVKLRDEYSAGILEWRVRVAP